MLLVSTRIDGDTAGGLASLRNLLPRATVSLLVDRFQTPLEAI